jgi:Zn-finger nucleic acid-binding protein
MKCPVDNTTLTIAERVGVEIDYCPECRGVWLDRGELDKLIAANASNGRSPRDYREDNDRHHDDSHREDDRRDEGNGTKKRRGSFLEDVFGGFGD